MGSREIVSDQAVRQIGMAMVKSLEVNTSLTAKGCCIAFALDAGLALRGRGQLNIEQYHQCARAFQTSGEQPLYMVAATEIKLINDMLTSVNLEAEVDFRLFVPGLEGEVEELLTGAENDQRQIMLIGIPGNNQESHMIAYLGRDGDKAIIADSNHLKRFENRNTYGIAAIPYSELLAMAVNGEGSYLITLKE